MLEIIKMNEEERKYLLSRINNEGFDYCFIHYSDFKEIKDKDFHKYRKRYIKAQKELLQYIENSNQERGIV